MTPGPVTLTGQHVRIEPLTATHVADLALVAVEPEMWAYLPARAPRDETEVAAWIAGALA